MAEFTSDLDIYMHRAGVLAAALRELLDSYERHLNETGYNPDQSSVVKMARQALEPTRPGDALKVEYQP